MLENWKKKWKKNLSTKKNEIFSNFCFHPKNISIFSNMFRFVPTFAAFPTFSYFIGPHRALYRTLFSLCELPDFPFVGFPTFPLWWFMMTYDDLWLLCDWSPTPARGGWDSNPQPCGWEPCARPLGYPRHASLPSPFGTKKLTLGPVDLFDQTNLQFPCVWDFGKAQFWIETCIKNRRSNPISWW